MLTLGLLGKLDERYVELSMPGPILEMVMTNLRNRPLSRTSADSMRSSFLSLYHSLVTGSKDFPLIPFKGFFCAHQMAMPFAGQGERENTAPTPLTAAPAGCMVPPAGSSSSPPNMLTPVLPEKTELGALRADRRNCVRTMKLDGVSVTRVISTVYCSEGTELTNRWRVTDYSAEGRILMSVLCQFTKMMVRHAMAPRKRKRKDAKEESSSSSREQSPPKKRLRL